MDKQNIDLHVNEKIIINQFCFKCLLIFENMIIKKNRKMHPSLHLWRHHMNEEAEKLKS